MRYAIELLVLFLTALTAPVDDALAQAPDQTKRVGFIVWSAYGPRGHLEQALVDAMRDRGYIEGKNLVIERRYVDAGGIEQVRVAASELAALKLDAIVSTRSPSTAAVKQATANSSTPVVMAVVSDPVSQALIASYDHPGGNVTGLSSQQEDTLPKMLQYLSELLPSASGVAVLHNTGNPVHPLLWQRLEKAGRELGTRLVRIDVSGRKDFGAAFDTIQRERLAALLVLPDDNMTFNSRVQLLEMVQTQRIPTMFGAREFVDAGGLMSYGPNYAAGYRQAAVYLDKVLVGAKPANLPVEQPTRFEFVVNVAAAKALGVAIPPRLLLRADDVVR